jgi:hypothetical protein
VSLYHYLGSTDNADFARIARSHRVIFVEGKDGRTLRRFAARCDLKRLADPQGPAIVRLGGFSQWRRAIDAVWAFKHVVDLEIEAFCLFDRDYRSDEQVEAFITSAAEVDVVCHVLGRKEIENYLLIPDAIHRAVVRRMWTRATVDNVLSVNDVNDWLNKICEEFKIPVMSQRMANILQFAKERGSSVDQSTLISQCTTEFEEEWRDASIRLTLVPGKEVLARLNDTLQSQLKVSVTEAMLIDSLQVTELDSELREVLRQLNDFCDD